MRDRVHRRRGRLAASVLASAAVALALPGAASAQIDRDDFKRDCEANGGTFVETKDEHGNTVYRCRTNDYTENCTNTGNRGHVCIRKWRTHAYVDQASSQAATSARSTGDVQPWTVTHSSPPGR